MAPKKPRTPDDIAKTKKPKETYSFSLERDNVEILKKKAKAHNLSVSELVDEAIQNYIDAINGTS